MVPTLLTAQGPWRPYIEGWGRYGDWRQGGSGNIWAPVHSTGRRVAFVDLSGWRLHHQTVASGGFGARSFVRPNLALGFNGFVDYVHPDRGGNFVMLGAGAEAFTNCFEGRVNGYFPTRRTHTIERLPNEQEALLIDNLFFLNETFRTTQLHGYTGFDAEGGYVTGIGPGYLRAYAGYYYFGQAQAREIQGPRLRVRYEWDNPFGLCGTRLTIGGQWQYDRVRKSQGRFVGGIRVPLGKLRKGRCCSLRSICRRMGDPVHREPGLIWAVKSKAQFDGIRPLIGPTGLQLQGLFFDQDGGGTGSQIDPLTVVQAQAMANPYDLLFGLQDTGNVILAAPVILQDNQQLYGFGDTSEVTITLPGGVPFTVMDLSGAGRVILTADPVMFGIQLADNSRVDGVGVNGTPVGSGGIQGGSITTATVANTTIEDIAIGASVISSAGLTFEMTTIDMMGGSGAAIDASSSTSLTLDSVTIMNVIAAAAIDADSSIDFTMTGSTIDTAVVGISANSLPSGTFAVSSSTFENLTSHGIDSTDPLGTLNFTDNDMDGFASGYNFTFNSGTRQLNISGGTLQNGVCGIEGSITGTGSFTGTMDGVTLRDMSQDASSFSTTSGGGVVDYTFSNNMVSGMTNNSYFWTAVNPGATQTLRIVDNNFMDSRAAGIAFQTAGTGGPIFATITGNELRDNGTAGTFDAINFSSGGAMPAGHTVTALVSGNMTFDTTGNAVGVLGQTAGDTVNMTVRDHRDTNSGMVAGAAYEFQALGGVTMCATIKDNDTDNATGIEFSSSALTVTDVATLSPDNFGISVSAPGGLPANTASNCPLPPS